MKIYGQVNPLISEDQIEMTGVKKKKSKINILYNTLKIISCTK